MLKNIHESLWQPEQHRKVGPRHRDARLNPPATDILPWRQAVKEWKSMCAKGKVIIYIDGSGVNNKEGAAMV